jgi:hypothetical protein
MVDAPSRETSARSPAGGPLDLPVTVLNAVVLAAVALCAMASFAELCLGDVRSALLDYAGLVAAEVSWIAAYLVIDLLRR